MGNQKTKQIQNFKTRLELFPLIKGVRGIFVLFIFLLSTSSAFALVSGNGYQMYEQVTAINDTSTGGGYSLRHSGNTINGSAAGGGFSILNGGSPSFLTVTPPVVVSTPAPSGGGGGGGGGGSIVYQPATTTPINNTYQNQTGNQNQKTDFSNDFRADINDSGKIDVLDFNTLMANWGKTGTIDLTKSKQERCPQANIADVNCDGKINVLDFNLVLVYWGQYVGNEGVVLKSKGIISTQK